MANFNKVILAGNLTRDPQLSYLPSNTPVCEFGMAINRKWKAQNGEMREEVCYVDLRAFGRPAETINQYMKKGQPLLVEGRLRYDSWEGKDGQKKSRLTVVVDTFQFLGGGGGGRGGEGGGNRNERGAARSPAPARAGGGGGDYEEMPPMDDGPPVDEPRGNQDIPF